MQCCCVVLLCGLSWPGMRLKPLDDDLKRAATVKIFLAGRNVRNTTFTSSLNGTVLHEKMPSTEEWMELWEVGLVLTWVQPSLPKRLQGSRTSATERGGTPEMHRPKCPGCALSPRAPPIAQLPG